MKHIIILQLIFLVAFTKCSQAQDRHLWLRLSENRVIPNAIVHQVSDDSLVVLSGGKKLVAPLEDIVQVKLIRESSILRGAEIGAAIGLGAGAILGFSLHAINQESASPVTTTLILGILGGIIGSVTASFEHSDDIIDFTGKTKEEKKQLLERILIHED